ncbi:hypothetical protein PoB_005322400 [Plakobranchus ocellatus]|uniref:Uncharacterized protein n=1 Tax=Plakobranchus ocellatus TaxID=259542 RepID=A0AAV4C2G9_9GAST|nr:hypothetical protein PoB_005322400 [Plakobranchus ocellatus]
MTYHVDDGDDDDDGDGDDDDDDDNGDPPPSQGVGGAARTHSAYRELNLLVSIWLSAVGRANLRRAVPRGFRLSFCATPLPRLCKETAPLHKIAAWWHSKLEASDRECDKPRWQHPFDPVPAAVESRPGPN